MVKNIIIGFLGVIFVLLMALSFVQKSKQNKQQILLEQQHQIIKDLSIDLKNCEAREEVLIDITGSAIL